VENSGEKRMKSKLQLQKRLVELRIRQEEGVASSEDLEEIRTLRDEIQNMPLPRLIPPEPTGWRKSTDRKYEGSFGEFLRDVRQADTPGGIPSPRFTEYRAASGLSEAVPSDGGYQVGTDVSNELLHDAFETGVLASRCRKIELSSGSNRLEINAFDEKSRVDGSRSEREAKVQTQVPETEAEAE
jgi:HK97 family phage major capsid protein